MDVSKTRLNFEMNKTIEEKMKKFYGILSALLVIVILVSGCASSTPTASPAEENTPANTEPAETQPEATEAETAAEPTAAEAAQPATGEIKPFKYGFISWGTADEHGRTLNQAVDWAVEAADGEFIMDGSALSAETQIAAAENLIQSGANMISFCTYAGEATVPQISKLADENGVYWSLWDTTISDPDIQAMIDNDPYYVGNTNEDQYQAGYDMMKYMIEQGATKVIVFKYGVNIPTCDDRVTGAEAAAAEGGAEILYTIVAPDDYKKAAQDALTAYPDADAAFVAGSGTNSVSIAQAFKDAGKDKFYIGAFDYFDQMGDMLQNGELTIVDGGHMVTGTFSALMTINSYFGTPLSDGKVTLTIPYLSLKSYDDYLAYKQYASEGAAYTSEELQQFLKVYNPDLTLEEFQQKVSQWSIDDIKARKGE
jgi:ABC-type sugar transport system substrate-binding protein